MGHTSSPGSALAHFHKPVYATYSVLYVGHAAAAVDPNASGMLEEFWMVASWIM